jgi:hypothetical protein
VVLAHGGDRWGGRSPARRQVRREQRHQDPERVAPRDRAARQDQAAVQREPEAGEEGSQGGGDAEPAEQSQGRTGEAQDQRLGQHRAGHLPAAGAQRPQQRELPGSLGDQHGERVQDDERADEQGDPGEGRQQHGDERQPVLQGGCLLVGLLCAVVTS